LRYEMAYAVLLRASRSLQYSVSQSLCQMSWDLCSCVGCRVCGRLAARFFISWQHFVFYFPRHQQRFKQRVDQRQTPWCRGNLQHD